MRPEVLQDPADVGAVRPVVLLDWRPRVFTDQERRRLAAILFAGVGGASLGSAGGSCSDLLRRDG
jgi:hypothetical protein